MDHEERCATDNPLHNNLVLLCFADQVIVVHVVLSLWLNRQPEAYLGPGFLDHIQDDQHLKTGWLDSQRPYRHALDGALDC